MSSNDSSTIILFVLNLLLWVMFTPYLSAYISTFLLSLFLISYFSFSFSTCHCLSISPNNTSSDWSFFQFVSNYTWLPIFLYLAFQIFLYSSYYCLGIVNVFPQLTLLFSFYSLSIFLSKSFSFLFISQFFDIFSYFSTSLKKFQSYSLSLSSLFTLFSYVLYPIISPSHETDWNVASISKNLRLIFRLPQGQ